MLPAGKLDEVELILIQLNNRQYRRCIIHKP